METNNSVPKNQEFIRDLSEREINLLKKVNLKKWEKEAISNHWRKQKQSPFEFPGQGLVDMDETRKLILNLILPFMALILSISAFQFLPVLENFDYMNKIILPLTKPIFVVVWAAFILLTLSAIFQKVSAHIAKKNTEEYYLLPAVLVKFDKKTALNKGWSAILIVICLISLVYLDQAVLALLWILSLVLIKNIDKSFKANVKAYLKKHKPVEIQ